MEQINIAGVVPESIVDGPGLRFTVFVQGCPHKCKGCHNPETHSFDKINLVTIQDLVKSFKNNPLLSGITISGGEPFAQAKGCSLLAKEAKEAGLSVWVYTGYTLEELTGIDAPEHSKELLDYTDVLIDGRFMVEKRTLNKRFAGSTNQRLIDINKWRDTGKITELI